ASSFPAFDYSQSSLVLLSGDQELQGFFSGGKRWNLTHGKCFHRHSQRVGCRSCADPRRTLEVRTIKNRRHLYPFNCFSGELRSGEIGKQQNAAWKFTLYIRRYVVCYHRHLFRRAVGQVDEQYATSTMLDEP